MKRLVLAAICGVAITIAYGVPASLISAHTDDETLRWLLYIPLGWPNLILRRLVAPNAFPFRDEDRTALLIYILGSNMVLYGLLSYFGLLGLSLLGRSKRPQQSVPPPWAGR